MEKNNAIRFRKVKIYKNSTLYDIKTLNFEKKPAFYALKKLTFAEIQRYTVWKR